MSSIYNSDGSISKEFSFQRFMQRYKFLFPIQHPKEEVQYIFQQIAQVDSSKDVFIYSQKDYSKVVFISLLLKLGKYVDIRYTDLFSLTESWLGKNEDISSLTSVRDPYIAVYFSKYDLPNKNHQDVLLYILNRSLRPENSFRWMFYYGQEVDLSSNFPSILSYLKESSIPILHIKPFKYPIHSTPQKFLDSDLSRYFQ